MMRAIACLQLDTVGKTLLEMILSHNSGIYIRSPIQSRYQGFNHFRGCSAPLIGFASKAIETLKFPQYLSYSKTHLGNRNTSKGDAIPSKNEGKHVPQLPWKLQRFLYPKKVADTDSANSV